MLSLQGQRAADKINRRSLDTLTTQSTMFACVCLRGCAQLASVRTQDVKRHLEGVDGGVEYTEAVQ